MIRPRTPLLRPAAPAPQNDARYEDLRSSIKIDRDRLDVMVEQQSEIYRDVSEHAVRAASVRDQKRDELARTDAQIGRDTRARLTQAGDKVTDKIIEDAVLLHAEHQTASKDYRAAREQADLWDALRESFLDRRFMLRELVSLYSSGYFAEGSLAGSRNAVRDALAATAKDRVHEARMARTKT